MNKILPMLVLASGVGATGIAQAYEFEKPERNNAHTLELNITGKVDGGDIIPGDVSASVIMDTKRVLQDMIQGSPQEMGVFLAKIGSPHTVTLMIREDLQYALQNATPQDLQEIQTLTTKLSNLLQQQGIAFSVGASFGESIGVQTPSVQTEVSKKDTDTLKELRQNLAFATLTYTGSDPKTFDGITLHSGDTLMVYPDSTSGEVKITTKTVNTANKKGKKITTTVVMATVLHNKKEVPMPIGTIKNGVVTISKHFSISKSETAFEVTDIAKVNGVLDSFITTISDRNEFPPSVFFDGSDLYQSLLDKLQSDQMKTMLSLPVFTQKFNHALQEQKNKLVASATTIFLAKIETISSTPEVAQLCSSLSANVISNPNAEDITILGQIGNKTIQALGCTLDNNQISLYGVPLDMKKIQSLLSEKYTQLQTSSPVSSSAPAASLSGAQSFPWGSIGLAGLGLLVVVLGGVGGVRKYKQLSRFQ